MTTVLTEQEGIEVARDRGVSFDVHKEVKTRSVALRVVGETTDSIVVRKPNGVYLVLVPSCRAQAANRSTKQKPNTES